MKRRRKKNTSNTRDIDKHGKKQEYITKRRRSDRQAAEGRIREVAGRGVGKGREQEENRESKGKD